MSRICLADFFQESSQKCNYFSFKGKSNYTQEVKLQMMKRCTPSELKLILLSKDSLIRGRIHNFSGKEGWLIPWGYRINEACPNPQPSPTPLWACNSLKQDTYSSKCSWREILNSLRNIAPSFGSSFPLETMTSCSVCLDLPQFLIGSGKFLTWRPQNIIFSSQYCGNSYQTLLYKS